MENLNVLKNLVFDNSKNNDYVDFKIQKKEL